MPALDLSQLAYHAHMAAHQLVRRKRKNWAGKNAGVVLVFCIVLVIAFGLIVLFLYRKILARRAARITTA